MTNHLSSSEMEKRLQDIALVHIPTTDAAEIEERMDQAINRLQVANEDNYDAIGVLSLIVDP
jgi:hypothetical protein